MQKLPKLILILCVSLSTCNDNMDGIDCFLQRMRGSFCCGLFSFLKELFPVQTGFFLVYMNSGLIRETSLVSAWKLFKRNSTDEMMR